MLSDLVKKCRSCRQFDESAPVDRAALEDVIDLARLTASGGNLQPLKYYVATDAEINAQIFSTLRWAGYLRDWDGPEEGSRPSGYIVILRDNEITSNLIIDHGIAAQTMLLALAEKDLAGCIVGSVDRKALRAALELPMAYEILIVLAVGKPAETAQLEKAENGDIHYWRADDGMHVPKRSLDEIIVN